jgi:8-oxo-dGTP pyrophosphatase MutT (NUDIX family)
VHRRPLLRLLAEYGRRHPGEAACVERFCAFVAAEPGCFDGGHQRGHVTGSAWLVDRAGERVLLTHHRKLDAWVQLGGHADGEGDVLSVALREAREESGIAALEPVHTEIFDLDIHEIPARPGEMPRHLHYDVRFALRVTGSEAFEVSAESRALEWIAVDRLGELTTEPSMLRMASKWLQGPVTRTGR